MIRIPKHNEQNMATFVFFFLCLLCIGQYFGISAVNLLLTVLIIGVACLANLDDLFVIMYATLPLYNIINYKFGTYSMHYLIISIFIVKYFWHTRISVYKLLLFLALFVLRIFAGDFVLLVSWSLLIFPLVLTLDEPIWKDNIKKIVFWMNISMLLSCFAGYIMMIMQKTIYTTSYLYISGVSTVRFAGLTGDSVVFGQTCVLMIAINLVLCYFNPNRKGFYVTSSIILSMAALLSYSKMTLICIFLALLLFLALYGKEYVTNRKRFLRSLVVAGVLIVLVLAAISALMDYSGNSAVVLGYIDRFTRDDLSTGRFSLWGVYLEMLDSRPLNLFVPLTSKELTTPIWNPSTGGYVSYVHNLYLETVAAFGWCAAILIFMWIIRRLYRYVSKRNKMILLLPIFVLLFMGLGSHGNFEYQFYLQLALALAFMHPEMAQALRMEGDNDAVD